MRTTTTDLLTPDSLHAVAQRLIERRDAFTRSVQNSLIQALPDTLLLFPSEEEARHSALVEALAYVFDRTPPTGVLTPPIEALMRQLGRDHRKFRIPIHSIPTFARILSDAIVSTCADLAVTTVMGAQHAVQHLADLMVSTMMIDEKAGIPAHYYATVERVERRTHSISVVTLRTDRPLPYHPGQFLPVNAGLTPGCWRMLSPALPPQPDNILQFHIRMIDGGRCSPAFALSRPGDRWTLGAPLGHMHHVTDRDIIMIAHTQGLGILKSILLEHAQWVQWAQAGDMQESDGAGDDGARGGACGTRTIAPRHALSHHHIPHIPRLDLYFCAACPSDLYDIHELWQLSAQSSWLSLIPVVEGPDPHIMTHHTPLPPGLHITEAPIQDFCMKAARAGAQHLRTAWNTREVYLGGSAEFIRQMRTQLCAENLVDVHHLQHIPV